VLTSYLSTDLISEDNTDCHHLHKRHDSLLDTNRDKVHQIRVVSEFQMEKPSLAK
jgi:Asp-tRNA(Asn)/Glu-tRNA(Gln) amidotransferase B subunit